jgi:hypothetical protein
MAVLVVALPVQIAALLLVVRAQMVETMVEQCMLIVLLQEEEAVVALEPLVVMHLRLLLVLGGMVPLLP